LDLVTSTYPNILPNDKLAQWCENAGFIHAIERYYIAQKSYNKIIASLIVHEESRSIVFDFIEEHVSDTEEMRVALISHIRPLLFINPSRIITIINRYFSSFHGEFIKQLQPQDKLLYYTTLISVAGNASMTTEWYMDAFSLMLLYDPLNSANFLREHINEMDTIKAEKLSINANRIDCQVQIKIINQQYKEAAEQIGHEIERTLIDFVQSDSQVAPTSIDELLDIKELQVPMDAIRLAINLLETNSADKDNQMQWQRVYFYFQFPLYLAGKAKQNIKSTTTLMFTYFVVSSLSSITAHHAFCILSIHFSGLDMLQYREILTKIFSRINYEKNLYHGLEEMLILDCIELIEKVYVESTKGILNSSTRCSFCQKPLQKTGRPFIMFPCGHCYHTDSECLNGSTQCRLCAGQTFTTPSTVHDTTTQKLSTRRVQQLLRRMDFALKKNFGDSKAISKSQNSVFFAKSEVSSTNKIVLTEMAPPEDIYTITNKL